MAGSCHSLFIIVTVADNFVIVELSVISKPRAVECVRAVEFRTTPLGCTHRLK